MSNIPTNSAPYFVKSTTLTFTLDSVNIQAYNSAWYDSHQFSAKVSLPLTYDEFNTYVLSLFHYRVFQLSGGKIQYYNFSEMYMPSFIEACLSYVNNNYNSDSGIQSAWQGLDIEPLSIPEMLNVSHKLAIISKHDNDLVKGFPKALDTGTNNLYIVENSQVVTVSEIDPRNIGIAAVLNQQLSHDDLGYNILFRKIVVDQQYAVSEVLNAII